MEDWDDDDDFIIKPTSSIKEEDVPIVSKIPVHAESLEAKMEDMSDEEDLETKVEIEVEENVFVQAESDKIEMEYSTDEECLEDKYKEKVKKKVDVRLTSQPLVFTTRLDDMLIFSSKNMIMTEKFVTSTALKESMPKYNNKKPITKPPSNSSYQNLTRTINRLYKRAVCGNPINKEIIASNDTDFVNESVTDDVYQQKLLQMCKPFSIVLEKLEFGKNYITVHKIPQYVLSEDVFNFIFQDYSRNETDIYCIKNQTIKENYTLKNVNDEAIIPYINAFKKVGMTTRKVNFCCWHQREAFIVSLDDRICSDHIKQFMKKPHKCAFGQCLCCCRSLKNKTEVTVDKHTNGKQSSDISVEDIEINDLEKEISDVFFGIKHNKDEYGYKSDWLENLLSKEKKDTLVGKALSYNRLKDEESKPKTKTIWTSHFKDMEKSEWFVENPEVEQKDEDYLKHKKTNFVEEIICCWYGREKDVNKLCPDNPGLARYMKLPHTCLPGKCTCCCRPSKAASFLKKYEMLPNRLVPMHTKQVRKYTENQPRLNPIVQTVAGNIIKRQPPNKIGSQTRFNVQTKADCIAKPQPKIPNKTELIPSQKPIKILPKFVIQTNHKKGMLESLLNNTSSKLPPYSSPSLDEAVINNETTVSEYKQKQKVNTNVCVRSQNDQILKSTTKISKVQSNQSCTKRPQESSVVPSADDLTQDPVVDSMITTILDRFKDVRLTINEDGKIAAALKTPADTLTNAELKVLANILSHAQQQLKAMGLGPGSLMKTQISEESANTGTRDPPSCASKTVEDPIQTLEFSNTTISANEMGTSTVHLFPKPAILSNFSESSQQKDNFVMQSYLSYIDCKKDSKDGSAIPKISNVFSLKQTANDGLLSESVESFALNADSKSVNTNNVVAEKRKTNGSEQSVPSKIRVVDPAKLGIPNKIQSPDNAIENEKSQTKGKVLIANLLNSQLSNYLPYEVNIKPSSSSEIVKSNISNPLPIISNVIGNAVLPQTTSINTNNQLNNVLFINSLPPFNPLPGKVLIPSNPSNVRLTPVKMKTLAQNMQGLPQNTSGTVFHISNLDKVSIAEPRLLNVELQSRLNVNPPPLVRRVAPKPPKPTRLSVDAKRKI